MIWDLRLPVMNGPRLITKTLKIDAKLSATPIYYDYDCPVLHAEDNQGAPPCYAPRVAQNPRGNVALDCQGDSQGLSTSEAQSVELVFTTLKRFVQIRIKISSTLSERSLIACVS